MRAIDGGKGYRQSVNAEILRRCIDRDILGDGPSGSNQPAPESTAVVKPADVNVVISEQRRVGCLVWRVAGTGAQILENEATFAVGGDIDKRMGGGQRSPDDVIDIDAIGTQEASSAPFIVLAHSAEIGGSPTEACELDGNVDRIAANQPAACGAKYIDTVVADGR
ncbi:MAG: hypothetical protein JWL86_2607 [Rhizobium sp.]|nr:hypothetical protein [Rhizobium sp.]